MYYAAVEWNVWLVPFVHQVHLVHLFLIDIFLSAYCIESDILISPLFNRYFLKKNTYGQEVYENMLNITNYQGNANQSLTSVTVALMEQTNNN